MDSLVRGGVGQALSGILEQSLLLLVLEKTPSETQTLNYLNYPMDAFSRAGSASGLEKDPVLQ